MTAGLASVQLVASRESTSEYVIFLPPLCPGPNVTNRPYDLTVRPELERPDCDALQQKNNANRIKQYQPV